MKTAYEDGYETGLGWTESYIPGGPRVMHAQPNELDTFKKRCEQSQIDHKDWHLGFQQGLREQK